MSIGTTVCRSDVIQQPKDRTIPVWRYLTTAKFVSLLMSHKLRLTRLDLFQDQFEGLHTNALEKGILAYTNASLQQAKQMAESMRCIAQKHRPVIFVSCWCLQNHELEAMWRLYCGAGEGVAIVMPYDALVSSIELQCTHAGTLRYLNFDIDTIRAGNPLEIAMCKRQEFVYEQEARIAYYRPDWVGTKILEPAVETSWNPEKHIQRIVVSPHAPSWYINTLSDLVDRLTPKLLNRIEESAMRSELRSNGENS